MNIIKGLTAVTSLTVFMGMMAPTAIVQARTNSTNDSQIVKKGEATSYQSEKSGNAVKKLNRPVSADQSDNLFGNSLLQQGESGPSVAELQKLLQKLGYYTGSINGNFDNGTQEAVDAFQLNRNINDSGIVGAATKSALFEIFRNTSEYKEYQQQFNAIQQQEKKADFEKKTDQEKQKAKQSRMQKEARAKAAAAKAVVAKASLSTANSPTQATGAAQDNQPAVRAAVIRHPHSNRRPNAPAKGGRFVTVLATSYALNGQTATGVNLSSNPSARVIAVDPDVIPLGSRVLIPGYGIFRAADTGGAIKGNRIDIHFASKSQALNFGVQSLRVQILN